MDEIKQLKYYNDIINSEFLDDDKVSFKLLELYKGFVKKADVNKSEEFQRLKEIDRVLYKYIEDYEFSKEFLSKIDEKFLLKDEFKQYSKDFFDFFINFGIEYDENLKTFISQTRWI